MRHAEMSWMLSSMFLGLITGYCFQLQVSDALQINTYQENNGTHSVGSNVTVMTIVSDGKDGDQVAFTATNFSGKFQPVSFAYINDWSDPTYDQVDIFNGPAEAMHLNFSYHNDTYTRIFKWYFPYLLPEHNNMTLLATQSNNETVKDKTILDVSYCQKSVGNATADVDQCGYGCRSRFNCNDGYVWNTNSTSMPEAVHQCSATAEWNPSVPLDMCILNTQTNSPTADTPTGTTARPDSPTANSPPGVTTQPGDNPHFPKSGPCLAAIGGVLAAVCIALFMYMGFNNFDIPNKVTFYAMSLSSLSVWAIALGLCFGMSTNEAAVIAGIVLGSLALGGKVVVMGFQISLIKSHKEKGIPGKPEDTSL